MGEDLLSAISFLLSQSWQFLTSVTIPGTTLSFAALFVGLFLASLGLRLLGMVMGTSFSLHDTTNDAGYISQYFDFDVHRHPENRKFISRGWFRRNS